MERTPMRSEGENVYELRLDLGDRRDLRGTVRTLRFISRALGGTRQGFTARQLCEPRLSLCATGRTGGARRDGAV